MTIQQRIRVQTHNHIRPLIIKRKCESCGSKNNLELHHIRPFRKLLDESLRELGMSFYNTIKEYTDSEVDIITNYMLGKQLKEDYLTVCKPCHNKLHENDYDDYDEKRYVEEMLRMKTVVEPYLESRLGDTMLTVVDRKELIEVVNVRRNGRLLRSIDIINESLEKLGSDYRVVQNRIDTTVEGKREQYGAVWEVVRLSE